MSASESSAAAEVTADSVTETISVSTPPLKAAAAPTAYRTNALVGDAHAAAITAIAPTTRVKPGRESKPQTTAAHTSAPMSTTPAASRSSTSRSSFGTRARLFTQSSSTSRRPSMSAPHTCCGGASPRVPATSRGACRQGQPESNNARGRRRRPSDLTFTSGPLSEDEAWTLLAPGCGAGPSGRGRRCTSSRQSSRSVRPGVAVPSYHLGGGGVSGIVGTAAADAAVVGGTW